MIGDSCFSDSVHLLRCPPQPSQDSAPSMADGTHRRLYDHHYSGDDVLGVKNENGGSSLRTGFPLELVRVFGQTSL